MSDLTLEATKCPHGVWHPHNALRDDDTGEVVDDPEGSCSGGYVEVEDQRFHINHGLSMALTSLEAALTEQGEDV